ncbi:MAG TPA: pyridine nucleotide transhydrogenase, partial [Clostridiales bacterium]|nr:pyridine nucleotide transhydrogenase [Clostridiales bacterium]
MNPYLLTGIFIASAIVGYFLISHVPSLLHTPLMSGMNALSGLSAIGALAAAGMAVSLHNELLGGLAVVLAMVNI